MWDALIKAGTSYGITPYGTEAMHVLQAEKGYPIIRAGHRRHRHRTISAWAGRCPNQTDFIGKRSYARQSIWTRTANNSSDCCRWTRPPGCRRGLGDRPQPPIGSCRRPRADAPGTSPPATTAPSSAARSRWPLSAAAPDASAPGSTCPSAIGSSRSSHLPVFVDPEEPAAMAEIPMITPLANWSRRFAALAPAVLVSETPVAAISAHHRPRRDRRTHLPGACAISSADGTDAIWLGPDEWLLTRPGIAAHDWLPVLQTSVDAGKSARAEPISPTPPANVPASPSMDLMPQRFWRTDARSTCHKADSGHRRGADLPRSGRRDRAPREQWFRLVRTLLVRRLSRRVDRRRRNRIPATTRVPTAQRSGCPQGCSDDQPERDGQDRCHGR